MFKDEGSSIKPKEYSLTERSLIRNMSNQMVASGIHNTVAKSMAERFMDDVKKELVLSQVESMKQACINSLSECSDQNELCVDTEVVWIDLEEAKEACSKATP